jgi:hypothetical protein
LKIILERSCGPSRDLGVKNRRNFRGVIEGSRRSRLSDRLGGEFIARGGDDGISWEDGGPNSSENITDDMLTRAGASPEVRAYSMEVVLLELSLKLASTSRNHSTRSRLLDV